MQRWLPEFAAAILLPLLIIQARRVRRRTPRLPVPEGPTTGIAAGNSARQIILLALGESPVAGVGADTQEEAITPRLAQWIADSTDLSVAWQAFGANGADAAAITQNLLPALPKIEADTVLIALGINDTTAFTPLRQWQRRIEFLLREVERRCHPRLIILSGIPPIDHFPALPPPLRFVLGLKARQLDRALAHIAATYQTVVYVPLRLDPQERHMMASDGYHPSAAGYLGWARQLGNAWLEASKTRGAAFLGKHPAEERGIGDNVGLTESPPCPTHSLR